MSVTADSAATGVVVAGESPPGTPLAGTVQATDSLWQIELCDRQGNPLADVTSIAFDFTLFRGLNRPASVSFRIPSWHAYTSTVHTDGSPYCEVGVRQVKVRRRDTPSSSWRIMFNGILWHLEDSGDEDPDIFTQVTAYDPMIWWRYRPARGFDYSRITKQLTYNGNFSAPYWCKPQETIAGPVLLRQIIDHSRHNTTDAIGEGAIGISTHDGTVEETGNNVAINDLLDTPYTIAQIHKILADTNQVDAWIEPTDNVGSDVMGKLMAVVRAGKDKPWLHLQYGTGDYSCSRLRRERDMDGICNKLWYYLGERLDPEHWEGNITATWSGLPDPPQSAITTRMNNSRSKYGVFMDVRIYDANRNENEAVHRQLFARLWQTELYLRSEPREMLFATPTRNGPYDPFDIDFGDTIRVSAFDGIRRGFTQAVQRVYGYTVTVDPDMVEHVVELETSPNNE